MMNLTKEEIAKLQKPKDGKIAALREELKGQIDFSGMLVGEIKKGEQYEEAIRVTENLKITAGIWYLAVPDPQNDALRDRFGLSYVEGGMSPEVAFEFLYRLGVRGISFHYPGELGEDNHAKINEMLSERGMYIASIAANTFSYPIFSAGGPSNNDPRIREIALLMNMRAQELGKRYGCRFQTDWAGRDALAGYFIHAASEKWRWTRQIYATNLISVNGEVGYAIEFKPYDPGERAVIPDVNAALRMCMEVEEEVRQTLIHAYGEEEGEMLFESNYRGKMGVNIEDAHVYLLGGHQTVADAVDLCLEAGRLFLRHPNDSLGKIDTDDVFGKYHPFDALEACYYEVSRGYDGAYEPDIFPKDDDRLRAFIASINQISKFRTYARILMEEPWAKRLEEAKKSGKPSEVYELLDDLLTMKLDYPKIPLDLADRFRRDVL